MVISDALAEEIFQILSRLPYFTAVSTIEKMKAELAMQKQVLKTDKSTLGMTAAESVEHARETFRREMDALDHAPNRQVVQPSVDGIESARAQWDALNRQAEQPAGFNRNLIEQ